MSQPRSASAFHALALLVVASGCGSTSARPAFQDVSATIDARIGQRIRWRQDTKEDGEVDHAVRALLARELTVEGAVQIALVRSASLQVVYEDLSVAQADLVQAGLLRNPTFSGAYLFPVAGVRTSVLDLGIATDFFDLLMIPARRRIAESALHAVKLRVGDAVLRLAYDVHVGFYQLEAAQQILAMRRVVLEMSDASIDLAQKQYDAGNISEGDLVSQQATHEQLRLDVKRVEEDVVHTREALIRMMGLWGPDAMISVPTKLPELPATEVPLDNLETLAVSRRLDLDAARHETQAASHAVAMGKNWRWVTRVSVGASLEKKTTPTDSHTSIGPSGSLELPIFDQQQAMIARLESGLRAAKAREDQLAIDVRSEVRVARARVTTTRSIVERYAKVLVPLRKRVVTLTQEQYDAMLTGVFQLLHAKQAEIVTYKEFIEELRDYWIRGLPSNA